MLLRSRSCSCGTGATRSTSMEAVVASTGLFAWRHDDCIIIVDIDDTITKAEGMG